MQLGCILLLRMKEGASPQKRRTCRRKTAELTVGARQVCCTPQQSPSDTLLQPEDGALYEVRWPLRAPCKSLPTVKHANSPNSL